MSRTASLSGADALSEADSAAIAKWLIDSQLATTSASRSTGRQTEMAGRARRRKLLSRLNPISPRIPLLKPDEILTGLTPLCGWTFGPIGRALWLAVVLLAAFTALSHARELRSDANFVFSPDNWLWLSGTWLLLKIAHETAHGMACKRCGGSVREAGVVFILFVPLPYVDVTSAWRFSSRWKRILVSAGGMYAELFLAALATFVWKYSDTGMLRQSAINRHSDIMPQFLPQQK